MTAEQDRTDAAEIPDEWVEVVAKAMNSTVPNQDGVLWQYNETDMETGDDLGPRPVTLHDAARAALAAVYPLIRVQVKRETSDTRTLSQESWEYIGTSIQNAAHGVDFPLPEFVVVAITENLIASTWLTDRLNEAVVAAARRDEREQVEQEFARMISAAKSAEGRVVTAQRERDEALGWVRHLTENYRDGVFLPDAGCPTCDDIATALDADTGSAT